MKRRDLLKGGLGLLACGAAGNAIAARPCPPSFDGSTAANCPIPTGSLSLLANSMSPGAWGQITDAAMTSSLQSILNSYYPRTDMNRSFLEYSIDAKWYPAAAEIHFTGGGHPNPQSPTIHIKYSEATGSWSEIGNVGNNGHSYSHMALDPATGRVFSKQNADVGIRKYIPGGGWGAAASLFGPTTIADAMEWFPDANGGSGGLIYYSAAGSGDRVSLSNPDVSSWDNNWLTNVASSNTYHTAALYLPKQRVMMVGGGNGSSAFVAISPDGKVTPKASFSNHWGPGFEGTHGPMVAFASGRIFHFDTTARSLREFNFDANTWSTVSTFPFGSFWLAACAIDELGVIHVMLHESQSTDPIKQWVYKL